jgi:membrane-associated phospholipid phosphatase
MDFLTGIAKDLARQSRISGPRNLLKPPAGFLLGAMLVAHAGLCQNGANPQPELAVPLAAQAASRATPSVRKSIKGLPGKVLHDQEPVFSFPLRAVQGHHWKPALAVTLATTGLVLLDSHDTPYFRRTQSFRGFNRTFSGVNTGIGEGTFPLALFLAGRVRHSGYMQQTAFQAAEALADAQILSEVMKNVSRRLRPREIPPTGDYGHTWFKEGGGILIDRGSFPSGHAIGAFAVAAVVARRYPRHRWVPWVAYGAAALVGFSRISLQAHFPSDIFAGAALGYSIGHFVVLRRH